MEPLPYIDQHRRRVGATPERTWDAVVKLARGRLAPPRTRGLHRALALGTRERLRGRRGDRAHKGPGSSSARLSTGLFTEELLRRIELNGLTSLVRCADESRNAFDQQGSGRHSQARAREAPMG